MRGIAGSWLLVTLGVVGPATGQALTVGPAAYGQRAIEDVSTFGRPLMTEVRVSFPVSDRFAVEPFVDVPSVMVGVQVRQRLVRSTRSTGDYAFVTYGAATLIIGHVGVGWHHRLSDRLAVRSEVRLVTFHVVPVGVLVTAGLSVGK